jgi:hypothetical protein
MACTMLHFTIREVLLLTLVAAIAVAWWLDRSRLVRRRTAGMDAAERDKPQKQRWTFRQYSISTLMIVITLVSVVLALVVIPAERQRRAVAAIHKLGGAVWYDFEFDEGMTYTDDGDWSDLPGPDWLCRILGMDYFADAVQVEALDMTDAGLVHLEGLTNLQVLGLPQATDAGLEHLAGMTSLQELNLVGRQVTDAGLVHLAGLTSLEYLNLSYTQVSDAGLVHLGGFTSLEKLYMGQTQVTSEGFDTLRRALPHCSVIR